MDYCNDSPFINYHINLIITNNMDKIKNRIQLTMPIEETTEGWFNGEKIIPFNEMTSKYLQNAFTRCRKKVLYYHNRMGVFDKLSEQLEEEAERRRVLLIEPDTQFERNTKKLKI